MFRSSSSRRMKKSPLKEESRHEVLFSRPQGAPRGLLLQYILHRISIKPSHGYEIARGVEEKSQGAWRPAPGSIYPMLRKLSSEGLIKATVPPSKRSSETEQRIYEITPKGTQYVKEGKEMFANIGQRWSSMRRLFIELMDSDQAAKFLIEGSKNQFEMSQDLIENKLFTLPRSEAEYVLKEYTLNLERQLDWVRAKQSQVSKIAPTPRSP
jgi:DNA-binding PadR family transcriptional regulator